MGYSKKVCIAFLGNAFLDSRITNLKNSLENDGCKVKVISFDWFTPNFKTITGDISVFKLRKTKFSIFFYLHFLFRLKIELLKCKADIYFAEEIYSLPLVTIFGKLHSGKVYYNSRELYAFLGGLTKRKNIQWLFQKIEKFFISKVNLVLTTGEMDSEFIEEFYGLSESVVIRNIPLLQQPDKIIDLRDQLCIKSNDMILLYQGVMIGGRGLELIFQLIKDVPDVVLVLLGDGEKRKFLESFASKLDIQNRVFFLGMKTQDELINYTAAADVGLALIENISKSYYFALPNKLFEYIMAGLPVICSDLPQMKNIVETYDVGSVVDISQIDNIINVITLWKENPDTLNQLKKNCTIASTQLNWQKEYERVRLKLLFS